MEPLPVTFSDLEGLFCCLEPLYLIYLRKYSDMFARELKIARGL